MTSDPTAPLPTSELPAQTGRKPADVSVCTVRNGKEEELRLESSFQHTKPVRSPSLLLPVGLNGTTSLFKSNRSPD